MPGKISLLISISLVVLQGINVPTVVNAGVLAKVGGEPELLAPQPLPHPAAKTLKTEIQQEMPSVAETDDMAHGQTKSVGESIKTGADKAKLVQMSNKKIKTTRDGADEKTLAKADCVNDACAAGVEKKLSKKENQIEYTDQSSGEESLPEYYN